MPNTGKPSRDCHLCRARRVKCDLNRPSCFRCIRYGAVCPGYRQEIDTIFQNESQTTYAARKFGGIGLYLKGRHKQSTVAQTLDFSWLDSDFPTTRRPNAPLLPRSTLTEDMRSLSVCLVQDRFSFECCNHLFESLFNETKNDTSFTLIAEACALAHRYRQSHSEVDRRKSMQKYVSALQATNTALCSPTEAIKDGTLAAVGLFGIYEITLPPLCPENGMKINTKPYYSHTKGQITLLRLRGPEQLVERRGRNLFWMIFGRIIVDCTFAGTECPTHFWPWLENIKHDFDDFDTVQYGILAQLRDMNSLCSKVLYAICDREPVDAYAMLSDLMDTLHDVDHHSDLLFKSGQMRVGPQQCLWDFFRCIRSKLHHCVILLINYIEDVASEKYPAIIQLRHQRVLSVAIVRLMAQEILDSLSTEPTSAEDTPKLKEMSWGDKLRGAVCLAHLMKMCSATGRQRKRASDLFDRCIGDLGVSPHLLLVTTANMQLPKEALRWPPELLES